MTNITTPKTQPSSRIKAFDIIRGYFLIVILINHIELYPSFFDFFTGRGRLLVSAAEGFFFMSGLLVGMVYKRRLHMGMKFIFRKTWRRALMLYAGSVVLTLLFTFLAVSLNHPSIKQGLATVTNWPHIIGQILLLRYGFGWADFLDRFAILMFMAPFALYLLNKGKWWLLALISVGVWAAPGNENPLDTLNWQIIFMMGMLAGFYWNEIQAKVASIKQPLKRRLKIALVTFAGVTFALSYASVFILSKMNQRLLGDPQSMSAWWQSTTNNLNSINEYIWLYAQKWTVGPLRIILFVAWFSVLFMLVQRYEHQITRVTRGFIELLGRNSLFVYIDHAFIVFAFKFFIPANTNIYQNFAITAAALALLIITTYFYVNNFAGLGSKKLKAHKPATNQYSQPESAKL
jgi:hypothetical protein